MRIVRFLSAMFVFAATLGSFGQESSSNAPTPLSQLLTEASANNSRISAANHGWQAAKEIPRQVTTLPDPTVTYQNLSVGSPKPFAGYTTSDFAYVGIGASQELPYPGKLRLRGEVAKRDADVKGSELDATRTTVADAVKADYLQLAYMQKMVGILVENRHVMDQLIQDATAHYQVGQGLQEDVLQAQVERTKIVRKITLHHQQVGQIEAHLKGLLHRDQGSPDIVAEDLTESLLLPTSAELLQMVRGHNPQVQVDASSVSRQDAALASAKREGKPDFALAYMYQNTDPKYSDYCVFTLNVRLPRRSRVHAEVAETAEKLAQSKETLDADLQQQLAEVKQQYVTATSDSELLKEYREGLIPQSDAAYRATLNAYAANRDQFSHVLLNFVNVLGLKLDEAQVLADHETALAHLETLTGATLR
ncbi:MAG: TolC family protein [Acidobacteriaceae bacterium]